MLRHALIGWTHTSSRLTQAQACANGLDPHLQPTYACSGMRKRAGGCRSARLRMIVTGCDDVEPARVAGGSRQSMSSSWALSDWRQLPSKESFRAGRCRTGDSFPRRRIFALGALGLATALRRPQRGSRPQPERQPRHASTAGLGQGGSRIQLGTLRRTVLMWGRV